MPRRTFTFPLRYDRVLRQMAKADEETMSVTLRQLIREKARERGLWRKASGPALKGTVGTMDKRLLIRISPFHKRIVQQMADSDGESISAFVRGLIREEALRRSLWSEVGRR